MHLSHTGILVDVLLLTKWKPYQLCVYFNGHANRSIISPENLDFSLCVFVYVTYAFRVNLHSEVA